MRSLDQIITTAQELQLLKTLSPSIQADPLSTALIEDKEKLLGSYIKRFKLRLEEIRDLARTSLPSDLDLGIEERLHQIVILLNRILEDNI